MDMERELGKRLAAAYISYTMGVTLSTAYQKIKSDELGEYWQQLARRVFTEMTNAPNSVFPAEPRH